MKIMVVGGGGREHAIIKKLKENKEITEIFALPGNGGMAKDATLVNIGAKDIEKQVEFAINNKIDYAIVAPDDPLVLGAVDALTDAGIPCFGPNKAAAIIETTRYKSSQLLNELEEMKKQPYLEVTDFSSFIMDSVSGNFGGEIRLGYESDGVNTHSVVGGSISANFSNVLKNIKFSKETRQLNNYVVPCAILLTDVSVAGE